MLKHFYKGISLIIVFVAGVYFFGRNINEVTIDFSKTVEVGGETFPVLSVKSADKTCNRLYGYSGSLEHSTIRESITPIGADKTFSVSIKENASQIQKIIYEVRDILTDELLDTGSISALDVTDDEKTATIQLEANLDTSTEYAIRITAVTKTSNKIHYYTRIKYYMDETYMIDKLDFVMQFHDAIFDKSKEDSITPYLEPLATEDQTSLANINIHSSYNQVTWAALAPKVISDIVPTIKEFNIETASIELKYMIEAETESGVEKYSVSEFYRVRYFNDRIYLLTYERTMESVYDPTMASLSQSEIKLGITSDTKEQLAINTDHSKMTFVRNGSLYYLDLVQNQMTQVYTFYKDSEDYEHELYAQQDVRIVKMDEEGNIYFVIYGYMTRGDYEGKVAIVLYKFHVEENTIEELLYMPLQTTYQMLKEDFKEFSYMNSHDVFYFVIHDVAYSYNVISKNLKVIAKDLTEDNFLILENANCFVWSDATEKKISDKFHIFNLETGMDQLIQAPEGKMVEILGSIDSNIVYGDVKEKDIIKTKDGTIVVPIGTLTIINNRGEPLKTYSKKGNYITKTKIADSVITMELSKKNGTGNGITYEKVGEDNILNQTTSTTKVVSYTTKLSDKALTEWYIALPANKVLEGIPKLIKTDNMVISQKTSLHLNDREDTEEKYYVHAYGRITNSFYNLASAIQLADQQMGVVISDANKIIWERGGKFNSNSVAGIEVTQESNSITSVGACMYMLLKSNHQSVKATDLSANKQSIYDVLKEYLDTPVNLTGCNLDEILYFVSKGKPVIAMKNNSDAVLITAYDEISITVVDPSSGSENKINLTVADQLFKDGGNVFISYVNE